MKNWKRTTVGLLLVGCLAVTSVPTAAFAVETETTAEQIEAKTAGIDSGKCGENVAWALDTKGNLIISGSGSMTEYDVDRLPWYGYRSSIKSVEVLYGVTNISKYAFDTCKNLKSVSIADTVKTIGVRAFADCDSLTEMVIPDSVTELGYQCFMDCNALKSVKLGNGLTEIGVWTFNHCTALKEVVIGSSVAKIKEEAFRDCTALATITLPDNVSEISENAFNGCAALADIYLGKGLTLIERDAFSNCPALLVVGYTGTADMWKNIVIEDGNDALTKAKRYDEYVRPSTIFSDVSDTAYYANPVLWAYQKGITNGATKTTFEPNGSCTRAQVTTFLWRAMGSPEPKSTQSSFSDVKDSSRYYYKAVLWATEEGIAKGMTATLFAPDETVTRGQFVTLLHRAEHTPATTASNPFTDVPSGKYYTNAVLWAVENGITNGVTAKTFEPDGICNRGQVVTFLNRDLG